MTVSRPPDELSCLELVELISDFIEGRLSADERARFDAHMDACDGCATYLDQISRTIELTGALRADSLEPAARLELLDAFRGWAAR